MANKSIIRLRMSSHDAHYGGNLVDGARMLQLFGDVATELLIQRDGDEGLGAQLLEPQTGQTHALGGDLRHIQLILQ